MRTSTKHYENLNSIVAHAKELHPDLDWGIGYPAPDITETYGKGVIIIGRKGAIEQSYFILEDDPRLDNWIHMIAIQVEDKINGK